jgi:hypothetical protein
MMMNPDGRPLLALLTGMAGRVWSVAENLRARMGGHTVECYVLSTPDRVEPVVEATMAGALYAQRLLFAAGAREVVITPRLVTMNELLDLDDRYGGHSLYEQIPARGGPA